MTRARDLADLLTGGQTITTADNTTQLTLTSTDADAGVGPRLDLKRDSGSPADSDFIGRIRFLFDNDGAEQIEGVRVDAQIGDASDGTEDVGFEIQTMVDGTLSSRMAALVSETIFNEDSKDLDFRVESNGNANMLVVDAGNDRIGIGTNTPAHDVEIVVTNAGSVNDSLQIRNNATSSGTGSRIRFINSTDNTSDANGASISSVRSGDDNDLVFETENSEVMRIDHAGSVGIGEDNPATTVHITASAPALSLNTAASMTSGNRADINVYNSDRSGVGLIRFGAVTDNVGTNIQFSTRPASGSLTEAMRVTSDGSFLVGTTSYDGSHFNDSSGGGFAVTSAGKIDMKVDGTVANFNRTNSSDGDILYFAKEGAKAGSIGIQSSGFFIDGESGHEGIRFANGAITPRENGSDSDGASDLGATNNRFARGYFSATVFAAGIGGIRDDNTYINFAGSDLMQFFIGGSEAMRINASSHVNIGQSATNIPGQGNSQAGTSLRSVGDAYFSRDGDIALNVNRNGSDGKVVSFRRGGTEGGSISVTTTSATLASSSDARLKSNIQDAASASDKIDAIQVRQFDWNETGNHQDYGLVAQELQPIEPLAVVGSPDSEEMMGIDNSKLVPMLIKEIQELRSRVAALEAS